MNNQEKQDFIRLRAIEGRSLVTIAKELQLDPDTLKEWDKKLENNIIKVKAEEYDKILESNNLNSISRFKHLVDIYNRLQKEIDKRDFSGLPTDKLYYILNDVYELIESYKKQKSDSHV